MTNQEILERIKRFKKQALMGLWLFIPVFGIPIFIFQISYPKTTIPFWVIGTCFVAYNYFFIFLPIRELSNIKCPKCEGTMKLSMYTNIEKIKCYHCGHVILS